MSSGFAARQAGTFVEASAGTGKTTALVDAVAAAIADGVDVGRIVAVTFTHQAAGEMKLRVREALAKRGTPRALEALHSLDRAFIGTIHSFCATLLRQRPVEGCVDPDFVELDETQAFRVFGAVFDDWLEGKLDAATEVIRRALAREAWRDSSEGPITSLRSAAWQLAKWRDLDAPWEKRPVDRIPRLSALLGDCEAMLAQWPPSDDGWRRDLFAETVGRLLRARDARVLDIDEAEAELAAFRRRFRDVALSRRTQHGKAWDALYSKLRDFGRDVDADLASYLRDELWQVVLAYDAEKARRGCVDFTDLLLHAGKLLQHQIARADLQSRYDRIFVDEFQDTDPLQAEILTTLATPEKLFVVGDPKQSIYRFRRAEPRVYADVREMLTAAGAERRTLQHSWRSNSLIQEFVNSAFASMPEYLPILGGPEALDTQPSIIALPAPRPYAFDRLQPKQVVECTPAAVAAFIEWLVSAKCSWTLRGTTARRRINPGDICILFRRATNSGRDLTEDYVRALEARNLPHVLVGSKGLHSREETMVLRTALRAIEWPNDELSVYAVLRGPLFGLPDNSMLRCRESGLRLCPTEPWPIDADPEFEPIREALAILLDLHRGRNSQPVASTIRRLLEAIRGHAIFAFHKGGPRRLANLHRVAELARQADSRDAGTFRSFVEYLEMEAASGEAAEAPVIEQQNDGILLMTTHKAKGLQFPVVILADPTAGLVSPNGCDRWIDLDRGLCAQRLLGCAPWELLEHEAEEERAERAEGERIAYVAATRAQDLLVVCAIGDTEYQEGWLSPLYDAVYPAMSNRRKSLPAPGCPSFGELTVLNAPMQPQQEQIRPGLHRPRAGSHGVVWFDPAILHLDVKPSSGADREHLLHASDAEVKQGVARYRAWQAVRRATIDTGSAPSLQIQPATELTNLPPEALAVNVEVIQLKISGPRPYGRKFGRLVHAILENGGENAAAVGRSLGASRDDIDAAEHAIKIALAHPLLARGDAKLLYEYPLSVRLDNGMLIEGRADLVRDEGDRLIVIDYKTDADRVRAVRQLQLYAYALQRATRKPARAVIFEL
jgi:ATP-dependent helicase/nuclease subunit A